MWAAKLVVNLQIIKIHLPSKIEETMVRTMLSALLQDRYSKIPLAAHLCPCNCGETETKWHDKLFYSF